MKTNKLAIGLLVGLSIGGIVGVLFAPRKGLKLEKYLIGEVHRLNQWNLKFENVITKTADSFELAQGDIEEKIALIKLNGLNLRLKSKFELLVKAINMLRSKQVD